MGALCDTHLIGPPVRPVVVWSHLAVLVVGGDFLLLEELVETGLGVLQGPVAVQVGIQVNFLRLQSLPTGSKVSGRHEDGRGRKHAGLVPPGLPARLSLRNTPSGWLLAPTRLLRLLPPTLRRLLLRIPDP